MNFEELYKPFKTAPIGLKAIIVFYGLFLALDVINIIYDFNLNQIVGLILSLLTFFGFLLRWDAVRRICRFLIGFFFVAMWVQLFRSEKFRGIATDNAIYWVIGWILPILMFIYLGRPKVKKLFQEDADKDHPTKAVDTDAA